MSDFINQLSRVNQHGSSESREDQERRLRETVEKHERREALHREVMADLLALPLSSVRERIMESAATAQDGYSLIQIGNTLKLLDEVVHAVASMDERLRENTQTQTFAGEQMMRGGVLGALVGAGQGAAFGAR
jgi:hypothetical protein